MYGIREAADVIFYLLFMTAASLIGRGCMDIIWDAECIYVIVAPSGLIAVGGEILNVSCIIMLGQRLMERLAKQQYQILGQHLEVSKEGQDNFQYQAEHGTRGTFSDENIDMKKVQQDSIYYEMQGM